MPVVHLQREFMAGKSITQPGLLTGFILIPYGISIPNDWPPNPAVKRRLAKASAGKVSSLKFVPRA